MAERILTSTKLSTLLICRENPDFDTNSCPEVATEWEEDRMKKIFFFFFFGNRSEVGRGSRLTSDTKSRVYKY